MLTSWFLGLYTVLKQVKLILYKFHIKTSFQVTSSFHSSLLKPLILNCVFRNSSAVSKTLHGPDARYEDKEVLMSSGSLGKVTNS